MQQKLQVIQICSRDLGLCGALIFGHKTRYSLYQSVCLKVWPGSMPHDPRSRLQLQITCSFCCICRVFSEIPLQLTGIKKKHVSYRIFYSYKVKKNNAQCCSKYHVKISFSYCRSCPIISYNCPSAPPPQLIFSIIFFKSRNQRKSSGKLVALPLAR